MSEVDMRFYKLQTAAGKVIPRMLENNVALFLSVPAAEAVSMIGSLLRVRVLEIEPPATDEEAYVLVETLLGELLYDGKLKARFNLGSEGMRTFERLCRLYQDGPPAAPDPFLEVVDLYKNDVAAFTARRAQDENFRVLSDQALAAGRLR